VCVMKLSEKDAELFFMLYQPLLLYTNKKLKVTKKIKSIADIRKASLDPETGAVRDALYKHTEVIDEFISENPWDFNDEELHIVEDWKNFVASDYFVLYRYTKEHALFIDLSPPTKIYGVLALHKPFKTLFGSNLPIMLRAVLLPFKGKIVYDGITVKYPFTFGPGMLEMFDVAYSEAEEKYGIITKLPFIEKEAQTNTRKA